MADVQDLKSVLKLETANEACCRDSHSDRGARVTADAPRESPWTKEIEKLREKIQALMAHCQNLRRRRIRCWECGGAGHLRSSCPRINKEDRNIKCWGCGRTGQVRSNCPRENQEDPSRTSVTESKKVCSNRKGSGDENGDVRSRRPYPESCKYCSRIEKKFGVIDSIVHQVSTPSTSALDPWSDESVRTDQLADPEIKPIIEFKESSDEKPDQEDSTVAEIYCSSGHQIHPWRLRSIEKLQARMEEIHHLARERIRMASEKMKTRYNARATDMTYKKATKCGYGIRNVAKDSLRSFRPTGKVLTQF
ncbi:uncharacterized protein TNCV_4532681 [Trichonephila clavipes]|nr:uncharacterized protein TNCV_4532681 [Trichonephila clavipes]